MQVPGERYPRVDTLGYFSFHLIRPVCALGTFTSRGRLEKVFPFFDIRFFDSLEKHPHRGCFQTVDKASQSFLPAGKKQFNHFHRRRVRRRKYFSLRECRYVRCRRT